MKKTILLTFIALLAFGTAALAQNGERYGSSRLNTIADQLKRQTVDLADRTSERLNGNYSVSRSEMDEAFLAVQIDAAAGLFQQLARGNRRAGELRDASAILSDLVRRAPGYGANGSLWRDAQNSISDINREIGGGYGGTGGGSGGGYDNGGGAGGGNVIGRAYWRGTVDDRVQLIVSGKNIETRTISGSQFSDENYSFTTPLTNRQVFVDVEKKKGRGTVRVVQQPSRSNDFTAVIEISDTGGGAREYQLDIFWR